MHPWLRGWKTDHLGGVILCSRNCKHGVVVGPNANRHYCAKPGPKASKRGAFGKDTLSWGSLKEMYLLDEVGKHLSQGKLWDWSIMLTKEDVS